MPTHDKEQLFELLTVVVRCAADLETALAGFESDATTWADEHVMDCREHLRVAVAAVEAFHRGTA